jgi:hypothetical protein
MKSLQQIEWKSYTIQTDVFQYLIPGIDKEIAYLEQKTEKNNLTNTVSSNTRIVKTTRNKILKDCTPIFVKDGFLQAVKKDNPFVRCISSFNFDIFDLYKIKCPLDSEHEISNLNLVWVNPSSHQIFNSDGIPFSLPTHFNYIGTPFSDKYCYLKNLLKYLKTHEWVVNKDDLEIEDIPYYNAEKDYKRCISKIIIRPDQKSYEEMFNLEKTGKSSLRDLMCSYSFMYYPNGNKDWLGIAPFLKKPIL